MAAPQANFGEVIDCDGVSPSLVDASDASEGVPVTQHAAPRGLRLRLGDGGWRLIESGAGAVAEDVAQPLSLDLGREWVGLEV